MTTPGGVPNLPVGALTVDTLASQTQDMSTPAMRGRAADRVPSIFDSSTGGNMLSDLSPFGIIAQLFAGFNSHIANADPADIQGPEDLPGLLLDFIESLPVIGEMVGLLEAILGTYDGDDPVLLQIQEIFGIFRTLFAGLDFSDPSSIDPAAVWQAVVSAFMLPLNLLLGPNSPLNLANAFGRLSLPQFAGGVYLGDLTTSTPNLLEPFTATSVPSTDGWAFNSGADAAQVVLDGTGKALYLSSGVIKVESDQPLDTSVRVKYAGVSSTTGQAIKYVLETFTTADGSGTGTPVTIQSITNPSGTITSPVTLGNSSWAIPAGVQSVRPVLVADAMSAGTVSWLNTPQLSKPLPAELADGLPAAIQARITEFLGLLSDLLTNPSSVLGALGMGQTTGLLDLSTQSNQIRDILAGLVVTPVNSAVQDIKDWFTGLTGKTQNLGSGGMFDAAQLTNITNIPMLGQDRIIGDGGIATMTDTMQALRDKIFPGGSGRSLADLANAGTNVAQNATNAATISSDNSAILAIRNNQASFEAIDPTAQSTVPNSSFGSPLYTFGVTRTTAAGAFIRINADKTIGTINWIGYGNTNITAAYLTVWKVDQGNGTRTKVYQSADVSGLMNNGTTVANAAWCNHDIPTGGRFDVLAGEAYVFELKVVGTGTHTVVGAANATPAQPRTNVWPSKNGEVRNSNTGDTGTTSPATVLDSAVTYSNNVIGFEVGIADGDIQPPVYVPRTFDLTASGTFTIPDWAVYLDIIATGGGQGGSDGVPFGSDGPGGNNGNWAAVTLQRGTDIPLTTTSLSVTVGAGGARSGFNLSGGSNGGNSVVSGTGMTTLTATGGSSGNAPYREGVGGDDYTYRGVVYVQGDSTSAATPGNAPGGGGPGGRGVTGISSAYPGARGEVWIVARTS